MIIIPDSFQLNVVLNFCLLQGQVGEKETRWQMRQTGTGWTHLGKNRACKFLDLSPCR